MRGSGSERNPGGIDRTPNDLSRTREFQPIHRLDANPVGAVGNTETPGGHSTQGFALTGVYAKLDTGSFSSPSETLFELLVSCKERYRDANRLELASRQGITPKTLRNVK